MIIDTVPLAGDRAYLHAADGRINIASATQLSGSTLPIAKGRVWSVEGLEVYVESGDLLSLLSRQQKHILRLRVRKEIYPSLYHDPYSIRILEIGGSRDFWGGSLLGMTVLPIDGRDALVTVDTGTAKWESPKYTLDQPTRLESAAWDLAPAYDSAGFHYSLQMSVWQGSQRREIKLADSAKPSDPRLLSPLPSETSDVTALQVALHVEVAADDTMNAMHSSPGGLLGRPLLHRVALIEETPSKFEFYSVRELLASAAQYDIFERSGGSRCLSLTLPLGATLLEGESISIELGTDRFDVVEASLRGEEMTRVEETPGLSMGRP